MDDKPEITGPTHQLTTTVILATSINDNRNHGPLNGTFYILLMFAWLLCVLQSDLEQYKKALLDAGCDLSPLNYIKQWK